MELQKDKTEKIFILEFTIEADEVMHHSIMEKFNSGNCDIKFRKFGTKYIETSLEFQKILIEVYEIAIKGCFGFSPKKVFDKTTIFNIVENIFQNYHGKLLASDFVEKFKSQLNPVSEVLILVIALTDILDTLKDTITELSNENLTKYKNIVYEIEDIATLALVKREINRTVLNREILQDWENVSLHINEQIDFLQTTNNEKINNSLIINPKTNNTITGFKTTLTDQQQADLYKALQNNYIDCSEVEFKAMFTDNPKSIKWVDKGTTRHEPNKQTIFEFIYLLKEYNYFKDYKTELDTLPTNQNNLYRKLEFIFPEIKNFASSNNFKPTKNTPRKKELETIIKSL